MKLIGLIGGMSWESTVTYYQTLNTLVKEELGGLHSARCLLYSVDFAELEKNMKNDDWEKNAQILSQAAKMLEKAGADFILICTNTMHKLFDDIQKNINIPLLHIAQATADALKHQDIKTVALLGTKYTMKQDFFKDILSQNDINTLVPEEAEQEKMNTIIFDELCKGILLDESRKYFLDKIDKLAAQGAEGIILGCTELGLLLAQKDTDVPLFDTTILHAQAAVVKALN